MTKRSSAFAAVLLAGLLVCGPIVAQVQIGGQSASPVGQADAWQRQITLPYIGGTGIIIGDETTSYTKADVKETKLTAYRDVLSAKDDLDEEAAHWEYTVNDMGYTAAWAQGKYAVAEARRAGYDRDTALEMGKENVSDYYAYIQKEAIDKYSMGVERIDHNDDIYENHEELSSGPIYWWDDDYSVYDQAPGEGISMNISLVNGSQYNGSTLLINSGDAKGPYNVSFAEPVNTSAYSYYSFSQNESYWGYKDGLNQSDHITDAYDYFRLFNDIRDANRTMTDNLEMYTEQFYQGYEPGDIPWDEYVGPTAMAQEAATNYQETGYYSYAGAALSLQGLDGNYSQAMTMEVNNSGTIETFNGTMYTQWEPAETNGTFVKDRWYDIPSSEIVFFATNDGIQQLSKETIRITSMTNVKTGETYNETTLRPDIVINESVDLSIEQLQALADAFDRADNQEYAAATSDDSGVDPTIAAIVLLATVIVGVVISRD